MFTQTQKISLLLLALTYLLLTSYFQHHTGGAATDLPYNLTSTLGAIIFLSWGLLHFARQPNLRVSSFNKVLFIALCLISIPTLYPHSDTGFIVGHYLFSLWLCWCCILVLDQITLTRLWRNNLFLLLILSASIQSVVVVWQYFSLYPFDYLPLYSRPTGLIGQTNLLVSYLAMALGTVFYLLLKNKKQYLTSYQQGLFLFVIPLFTLIIVYSGSRTGLISLLLITIISTWAVSKSSSKQLKQWLLLLWLSIGLGFSAQLSLQPESTEFLSHKATNAGQRGDIYPPSIELLQENALIGIGYGNFERAIFDKTLLNYQQGSSGVILNSLQHPHNEFLYLAIQGGAAAIFGMLIIMYLGYRALGKKLTPALIKLLPITAIAIHSMVELPLVASFPHLFSLLLILYLLTNRTFVASFNNRIGPFIFKPVALVLFLVSSAFYISGLHTIHLTYQYRVERKDAAVYLDIINPYIQRSSYLNSVHAMQLIHQPPGNTESTLKIIQFYQKLIKKSPRPQYYTNLCLAYLKAGNPQKAKKVLSEAKTNFPTNFMGNNVIKKCEKQVSTLSRRNNPR